MRDKIYEKFKAKKINGSANYKTNLGKSPDSIAIVTDPDDLVIATIPSHIKNPMGIAKGLAKAMTESNLALTDLI